MTTTRTCGKCGAVLSGLAPEGLCPHCMFDSALGGGSDVADVPLPSPGRRFGDYELLEEIARGGMGVVFKARQLSLNRIVAVKMILSGRFASPEFVERFRAEARTAARLQHPNIVAIHEVGEHDGQPFFSMDYVEGRNLAQRMAEFALPLANVEQPADRAWLRERQISLVRLIAASARAVHYAHQQGVLHRDLKPGNILLDAYDQPRLTDFGLAKLLTDDSQLTTSGQALGSPSYMPPEQAAGKTEALGPPSDVYALGAILYHLLTGRPPFLGASLQETLLCVQQREPVAPRVLNPALARDLETICLKCLEKEPRRRYSTAEALAEELERWLRREPIIARPSTALERVGKWIERKPAIAALIALVGVTALAGLGGVLWQWRTAERARAEATKRARQEQIARESAQTALAAEAAAKLLAEQQRQRAETNFFQARRAVASLLNKVIQHPRLREADFHDLCRDLLQTAIPFYEEFVRQQADNPRLQLERGRAFLLLAQARHTLGENDRAIADAEQARAIFNTLMDSSQAPVRARKQLADTEVLLGTIFRGIGRLHDAEQSYRRAEGVWEQLAMDAAQAEHRDGLADTRVNLGALLAEEGRPLEAEPLLRQAVLAAEELVREHPSDADYTYLLGMASHHLGGVLRDLGRSSDAEPHLRRAFSLAEALTKQSSSSTDHRIKLADAADALGFLLRSTGREAEAEPLYRQAVALRAKLVEQIPTVPFHRDSLANSRMLLGGLLLATGRHDEAGQEFREALRLCERLVEEVPGRHVYLHRLASAHEHLGRLHLARGQRGEALQHWRQAVTLCEKLSIDFPGVARYGKDLEETRRKLEKLAQEQAP